MSQLGWVQILYDQQLTSIGYLLSAKIAIETQQFFCPPKPRVVGSIPASRTNCLCRRRFFVSWPCAAYLVGQNAEVGKNSAIIRNSSEGCPSG